MNRVLFSTLLLLCACSSKSESTAPTTPSSDSTAIENSEPAQDSVPTEAAETEPGEPGSFSNLQVLPKTMSDAQLKATMNQVSNSLGVQCDFCHVDEDMASDDNPHKVAARNMMTMTMELNSEFFGGEMVVTCMTCHKGNEHPAP